MSMDFPESSPFFEGDPLAPAPETQNEPTLVVGADETPSDPLIPVETPASATEKPIANGVPRKVVEQLRAERRQLREAAADLETRLAAAEAEARVARELAAAVQGVDPSRAQWDNRYMNALENLSQRDPAFARMAREVLAAIEKEDGIVTQPANQKHTAPQAAAESEPEAAAPVADPRVEALFARESEAHIRGALDGLTPEFQQLFTRLIVENEDNAMQLSRTEIRAIAAEYAKDNGFKPEQYLAQQAKPRTQGGAARAVPTPGPAPEPVGADGKPLPAPKSMQDWQAVRQARIRSILGR